jgi:hypothetical protein
MIDFGDEDDAGQADVIASVVGHDSDHFSQDLKSYDWVSILGGVGEFAHYLTDEHMKMLMSIKDKELHYGLYSWAGFGFAFSAGGMAISPDDFYEMQYRIAAKKKDIDDDDIGKHEGMNTGVAAAHDLALAIMSLSKQTRVDMHTAGDAGIGEARITPKGIEIDFYDLDYAALHKDGKLVITR